jgi:murein DD-endopeptidase MepM/ murein hydrolase activator NlpD
VDNVLYGAREGTMEYPGSGAGPDAAPTYVVKNKDTLDGIASRYGVSSQTIAERNKLTAPYSLRPGQTLLVPGARYVPPSEQVETASSAPPPSGGAPASGPPGPVKRESLPPPGGGGPEPKTASAASGPAASGAPVPLAPRTAAATPEPPAKPRFAWPLHGKVITSYGTDSAGQKSDGIDIAATNGAPVKAADDGKVVYVGDEVARLGNLVMVEHSGGYITAYGNTEAVLVKKGETVKKGATIARAGSSGGVSSPRLHFEVRRGGAKTVDPMTVLPPG